MQRNSHRVIADVQAQAFAKQQAGAGPAQKRRAHPPPRLMSSFTLTGIEPKVVALYSKILCNKRQCCSTSSPLMCKTLTFVW